MQKDRAPNWQDTNLSLFGSDIEKKCKEAASDSEPQWDGAGVKVGLQVWRIEQFRVKPWPTRKYGRFHVGDSYIILNTYVKEPEVNPDKLAWNVHFWIGSESTQDEYGTAAYKTVELDDKLRGTAVQHREVQEAESALFLGYFGGKQIMYLAGGVASGFKTVEAETRATRLLWVKGRAGNLLIKEVKLRRDAMNSGDVFILDAEEGIWQWSGKHSNAHERSKAAAFCAGLKANRGGKVAVATLVEGETDGDATEFWRHLPGERKVLGLKVTDIPRAQPCSPAALRTQPAALRTQPAAPAHPACSHAHPACSPAHPACSPAHPVHPACSSTVTAHTRWGTLRCARPSRAATTRRSRPSSPCSTA